MKPCSFTASIAILMIPFYVFLPQESIKCMRHAKRTVLTADDVDSALGLRNVEVNYLSMLFFWILATYVCRSTMHL